jgi:hypothetical protein
MDSIGFHREHHVDSAIDQKTRSGARGERANVTG